MEVTVAMLIAAIAIGITYTVYSIVVRSYGAYNTKNKDMAVLIRLDELLKKDFEQADLISKSGNHILFKNTDKLVDYNIEPEFTIRISGITDTFKVTIKDINTTFENTPVTGSTEDDEQNRIDELNLTILFEAKTIPYHYHKQYSAASLIQRKVNAFN